MYNIRKENTQYSKQHALEKGYTCTLIYVNSVYVSSRDGLAEELR